MQQLQPHIVQLFNYISVTFIVTFIYLLGTIFCMILLADVSINTIIYRIIYFQQQFLQIFMIKF